MGFRVGMPLFYSFFPGCIVWGTPRQRVRTEIRRRRRRGEKLVLGASGVLSETSGGVCLALFTGFARVSSGLFPRSRLTGARCLHTGGLIKGWGLLIQGRPGPGEWPDNRDYARTGVKEGYLSGLCGPCLGARARDGPDSPWSLGHRCQPTCI